MRKKFLTNFCATKVLTWILSKKNEKRFNGFVWKEMMKMINCCWNTCHQQMTHDIDSKIIDNKKEMKDTQNPSLFCWFSPFFRYFCVLAMFAFWISFRWVAPRQMNEFFFALKNEDFFPLLILLCCEMNFKWGRFKIISLCVRKDFSLLNFPNFLF